MNKGLKPFSQSFVVNPRNNIARKRERQNVASLRLADATRAKIEYLLRVELTDGCTVRAFHIVREDLKLRLRIHSRVVRQQECFVRLLGVGLLSILTNENLSIENSP